MKSIRKISFEKGEINECSICYTDMEEITTVEECNHSFCKECITEYIKTQIDIGKTEIICPTNTCKTVLASTQILFLINEATKEKYESFSLNNLFEKKNNTSTSFLSSDCSYGFEYDKNELIFKDPQYLKSYCLKGKSLPRNDVTCEENKEKVIDHKFHDLPQIEWAEILDLLSLMLRVFFEYASFILRVGFVYALYMLRVCFAYAWRMLPVCFRYASSMLPVCFVYASSMFRVCFVYASCMLREFFLYASSIIKKSTLASNTAQINARDINTEPANQSYSSSTTSSSRVSNDSYPHTSIYPTQKVSTSYSFLNPVAFFSKPANTVPSLPTKKDGTLDMRYSVNKQHVESKQSTSSSFSNSSYSTGYSKSFSNNSTYSSGPRKSDGTPDMRYKANR